MTLLEKSVTNGGYPIRYYSGIDIEKILNHPKDGSQGIIIAFFDSIETEKIKMRRRELINKILDNYDDKTFDMLIENENPYVILYETQGYQDIIFRSVKQKVENRSSILNIYNI